MTPFDSAPSSAGASDRVTSIVEWYTDQIHQGKPPTIESVCRRFPDVADSLQKILPLVLELAVPTDAVPAKIGSYRLDHRIGTGGLGTVYTGVDTRDEMPVAIKLIPADRLTAHQRSRFRREVELIRRLPDGPFVRVLDAGRSADWDYLVMNRIEGCNLREYIDRHGPTTIAETMQIGIEAADGLAIAHESGVMHRDIKPSNLMRTDDGQIRIVDFGLALQSDLLAAKVAESGIDDSMPSSHESYTLQTLTGTVLGTMAYMAPEQAVNSRSADPRSEIYSLGCTLYHCLIGHPPHADLTWLECLIARREQPPPSVREHRADVPAALDRVLRRCMARRPRDRYQTMSDVSAAIRKAIEKPNAPTRRVSRRTLLASALALCAVVVGWFASRPMDGENTHQNLSTSLPSPLAPAPQPLWRSNRGTPYQTVWSAGDGRFAHWNYIWDVMFSKDGSEIFSGGWDGQLVRWKTDNGDAIRTYLADDWISDIETIGEETFFITGHGGGEVLVWPADSESPSLRLRLNEQAEWPVLASSRDDRLVGIADDHSSAIHVYHLDDLRSGNQTPRSILDRGDDVAETVLAFGPDGNSLITVTEGYDLLQIGLADGSTINQYQTDGKRIRSITMHPDRPRFATLDIGGRLSLYEIGIRDPLVRVLAHDRPGRRVIFADEGQTLITSGEDKTIRRWDASSLVMRDIIAEGTRSNWGLATSPRDGQLVSCGTDQRLKFWPAKENESVWMGGKVWSVRFLHDQPAAALPRLITGGADGSIEVCRLDGGARQRLARHHNAEISDLAVDPTDPTRIASACRDGTVRIWNLADGSSKVVAEHPGSAWCVEFSPEGRWIVSGGWDRVVRITDLESGNFFAGLGHRHMVNQVGFLDGGRRVLSVGGDRVDPDQPSFAVLWEFDGETLKQVNRFEADAALFSVSSDPDSERDQPVWVGGSWGSGYIGLDPTLRGLRDDRHRSDSVCWSLAQKGATRASGLGDGTLRIATRWTGGDEPEDTLQLGPRSGEVHAVDISDDGNLIAAACGDGTVWVLRRQVR